MTDEKLVAIIKDVDIFVEIRSYEDNDGNTKLIYYLDSPEGFVSDYNFDNLEDIKKEAYQQIIQIKG